MMRRTSQLGFTAVELLVTLFVAAAFLVGGYELYVLIIKDSGNARAQSNASNVAYNYLQRYASTAPNPCVNATLLSPASINVAGLSAVTVGVVVTCPYPNNLNVSKVTVNVLYNNPQQTVQYSTYTNGVGGATVTTSPIVLNGLVGWWPFNGNANDSSGNGYNGTVSGATLTTGQNGSANGAYAFNGSSSSITEPSTMGLGTTNATLSCWVYNPTATNSGEFIKASVGYSYGIGIGSTQFDNTTPGTNIVMLYENVRWIATSTALGTGWHFVAMVIDGSGTPFAYRDGVLVPGNYAGTGATAPTSGAAIGGNSANARWFTGSIDDVRIYNRALSANEIASLYNAGAQ
ncbi:LamG domain-containing protein [Patescibacteria group bacterium]|nr:MAG: LamG domain-containing protein [Patescibacteria group bacterium]